MQNRKKLTLPFQTCLLIASLSLCALSAFAQTPPNPTPPGPPAPVNQTPPSPTPVPPPPPSPPAAVPPPPKPTPPLAPTPPPPPPPVIAKETILQNLGTDEIVFACRQVGDDPHWYANFSYYAADTNRKAYRSQGRLCKLNVRTGEVKTLVDDPQGSVRDPQVHYDGQKILFSWRKANTDNYHLYEINTDGSNLKQLTDGPYDDIEPNYLPDGGLVFASSRCRRWVNCWLTQVAILHRSDADGSNIRPISANLEQENTPWLLPDGRILYQRWEYIDRSQVHYHHLWTTNPDGTGQMV
ncbi:MAG TPA: hypothetical protein PKH31_17505, partial [Candidatus Sumerlaeota bacterium]|nr:hypothetical protein [Candidatus Sumerlaeota bacterium]